MENGEGKPTSEAGALVEPGTPTSGELASGCLQCRFEEPRPACPPAGAPRHSEMITDTQQESSHAETNP